MTEVEEEMTGEPLALPLQVELAVVPIGTSIELFQIKDGDDRTLMVTGNKKQAEFIVNAVNHFRGLVEALMEMRGIILDGTAEGFRPEYGDWSERLYQSQGMTYKVLMKAGVNPRKWRKV